jgi:capsular exopolysaccharide synthesis family protein
MLIQPRGEGPQSQQIVGREDVEPAIIGRVPARTVDGWGWTAEPPPTLDLMAYWRILLKRRWLILSVILVALIIGVAVTLLARPYYTAVTTIQIDREAARVLANDADVTPREQMTNGEEFFQTQYGLLRSRSLAQRVTDSLGLARDERFLNAMLAPQDTTSSTSPAQALNRRRERVVTQLAKHLTISPVRGSRLVAVQFTSPDPALSARITNAFAEQFIASNLDRRFESSAYARSFLERRLAQTREALNNSERQLVAYATAQHIIQLNDPSNTPGQPNQTRSVDAASLEAMNNALSQARAQRILAEQQWNQARGSNSVTEVLANPTIQQLTNQRATLSADYQNRLRTFLPTYPDMVQLRAQIQELDRQIASQSSAIRNSVQSQYRAALQNERQLQAQVSALERQVLNLRNRSIQYNILQREVDTNRALYDGLLQRYREVGVAGGVTTNNISIVDRAEPPRQPSQPRPLINMALALFGGVIAAMVIALGLEALDQAIRTPADVEQKLRLPVLGSIPLLGKGLRPREALADPRSPLSEAYYSLRSALQFSTEDGFPRSLLVTSTRPGEGKSTTSFAVALNVARLGYRTLLIDADLRNPSLHKTLGLDNRRGLTNLLTSSSTLKDVVQESGAHNLTVISCGPLPPNPAELLGTNRLKAIVRDAMAEYDVVIIDGPPVMGLADAPMVAAAVNGSLLVIEAGRTGRTQALAAARRLEMSNAHLLGVALTKFDAREASYGYGYAYEYDYSYGHREDTGAPTVLQNLRGQARRFTGGSQT